MVLFSDMVSVELVALFSDLQGFEFGYTNGSARCGSKVAKLAERLIC